MRTLGILLAVAWAGAAVAADSPDAYIADGRRAEAAAMAKAPGLARRNGDTLTFFSGNRPVARLTYRWQPNPNGDPSDYTFREAVRLREPGARQTTRLAAVGPDVPEASEAFIVDSRGQGWLFPDGFEDASPDGRYVTSLADFGFRNGPALIVDWTNPQKPTQIIDTTCLESHWLSATEISGICMPLFERKDLDVHIVRMRFKAQADGRWLIIEGVPVTHILSEMFSSYEDDEVSGYFATAKLSTPGPALSRMGPPLETLSGQ